MRKRLRKKKHLGEFKVSGIDFIIRFDKTIRDFDTFLDAFLIEAIEANHCFTACGGQGDGDQLSGFIELGMASDNPLSRLEVIRGWLAAQSDIREYRFGPLTDAWYGPFYDSDETGSWHVGEDLSNDTATG